MTVETILISILTANLGAAVGFYIARRTREDDQE